MKQLIVLAIAGLIAQLIDGSLGMGYGVTSSTVLLAAGLTPATASASVHLAELGTNIVSGFSHWKLKNVDWSLVVRLGFPGAIGSFAGATVLARLSTEAAKPAMAIILAVLGVWIMSRFLVRPPREASNRVSPHGRLFLTPLGLVGGFVDATGGGGWGPVSTTALISAGKTSPRTVIGSVDTSEFLVSAAASLGFFIGLGSAGVKLTYVFALLGGGLIAAPIAAWLVSRIPTAIMGPLVGGFIILSNLKVLYSNAGVAGDLRGPLTWAFVAIWAAAVAFSIRRNRNRPAEVVAERQPEPVAESLSVA